MDMTRKVIILNKLNSPLIAQAIFILKDDTVNEFSAVAEAERIVEEYMSAPSSKAKKHFLPIALTALTALGIILAIIMQ